MLVYAGLGRKLTNCNSQPHRLVDHVPLSITLRTGGFRYEKQIPFVCDLDRLMRCVLGGTGRQQFFDGVRGALQEADSEFDTAVSKNNPVAMYHNLVWVLKAASNPLFNRVANGKDVPVDCTTEVVFPQHQFPQVPREPLPDVFKELAKQRTEAIKRRAAVRQGGLALRWRRSLSPRMDWTRRIFLCWALTIRTLKVEKLIRIANENVKRHKEIEAENEIAHHFNKDAFVVWQGIFKLANTAKTRKRRWRAIPPCSKMDCDEAIAKFAKVPHLGGKAGRMIKKNVGDVDCIDAAEDMIQEQYDKKFDILVPNSVAHRIALQDLDALRSTVCAVPTRKTPVQFDVPVEAWRLVLQARRKFCQVQTAGVGTERKFDYPFKFILRLLQFLKIMTGTNYLPLQACLSQVHRIPKKSIPNYGDDEVGDGGRDLHNFGALWKSLFRVMQGYRQVPCLAFGGVPKKRREMAISVQESMREVCWQAGLATALRCRDAVNAFNSSLPKSVCQTLGAPMPKAILDQVAPQSEVTTKEDSDVQLRVQLVRSHHSCVETTDGVVVIHHTRGVPQGGAKACRDFNQEYWRAVADFSHRHPTPWLSQPKYLRQTYCLDKTTFVDDAADRHAARTPARLYEEVINADIAWSNSLSLIGGTQHLGKAATIISIQGPETRYYQKLMQKTISGCKQARYLGPMMTWTGGIGAERTARIRAAQQAYYQFAGFWKACTSWRLKQLVFGAAVQGSLLTGLTSFVLRPQDYSKLDATLCSLASKALKGHATRRILSTPLDNECVSCSHQVAIPRHQCSGCFGTLHQVCYCENPEHLCIKCLRLKKEDEAQFVIAKATATAAQQQLMRNVEIKYKSLTNQEVREMMALCTTTTEMAVQRLRMMQQVAKKPDDHLMFLASIYGTFNADPHYITERAKMFHNDLQLLTRFDDHCWLVEASGSHILDLLRKAELQEEFLTVDPKKIKMVEITRQIPPPGVADTDDMSEEADLTKPHFCTLQVLDEAGQPSVCGEGFTDEKGLRSHMNTYQEHRNYVPPSKFVQTNACPFCLSRCSSEQVAYNHVRRSFMYGVCQLDQGHFDVQVCDGAPYHCPQCFKVDGIWMEFNNFHEYCWHIRKHATPLAMQFWLQEPVRITFRPGTWQHDQHGPSMRLWPSHTRGDAQVEAWRNATQTTEIVAEQRPKKQRAKQRSRSAGLVVNCGPTRTDPQGSAQEFSGGCSSQSCGHRNRENSSYGCICRIIQEGSKRLHTDHKKRRRQDATSSQEARVGTYTCMECLVQGYSRCPRCCKDQGKRPPRTTAGSTQNCSGTGRHTTIGIGRSQSSNGGQSSKCRGSQDSGAVLRDLSQDTGQRQDDHERGQVLQDSQDVPQGLQTPGGSSAARFPFRRGLANHAGSTIAKWRWGIPQRRSTEGRNGQTITNTGGFLPMKVDEGAGDVSEPTAVSGTDTQKLQKGPTTSSWQIGPGHKLPKHRHPSWLWAHNLSLAQPPPRAKSA